MKKIENIDTLVRENTLLKLKVEKLTGELTRQLEHNVEYFLAIREKDKSITETAYAHRMLLSAGKMMRERYRVMAENIDEIIFILDIKGTYIYVNQKAADLYGQSIKDMIGKSIFEMVGRDRMENYKTEIFDLVTRENRDVVAQTIFNKGNIQIHLESHAHPIHDDRGEVIGVLNITHDCTVDKKKDAYISIEQSINLITSFSGGLEQTIRDIFLKLCQADCIFAGGLYLFNKERQLLELICHYNLTESFTGNVRSYDINSTNYAIVAKGIPQYELTPVLDPESTKEFEKTGRKTISIIPLVHEQEIVGCLNLIINNPEQFTQEDKSFIETIGWRIARIIGLNDAQMQLEKTIVALNDTISDLKIKQQMLIQKSKMESLGELSAGMAHEINQPLVIISLSIENIMQKMVMGKKDLSIAYLQRKFESILLNVTRIQQIVDNIRIFARDQSSIIFEKVNIGELIAKTLEMVSVQFRAEDIRLVCTNIDSEAHVIGNIFKLEQVLLNILSNSRYAVNEKYNKPGTPQFQKQIEIRASRSGHVLMIEVSDNGIGITEEHIEKLFVPFFTTKREGSGTGLGLPIVYGIVKEMNGDISVTSKVGEFTRIRIILPAV